MDKKSVIAMRYLMLCLLLAAGPVRAELLPSEATVLIRAEMRLHPERSRKEQTAPYVGRIVSDNLTRGERFALGEVRFLDFDPEGARDAFWEFREEEGLLGRVAWQRLMQIRFAAFGMRAEVERDMAEYLSRFQLDPRDRFDLMQTLSNLVRYLVSQGRPEEAVALIDAEMERLDDRAPYWAYALPVNFLSAYRAIGRGEEAERRIRGIVADLRKTAEQRRTQPPEVASLARFVMFGEEAQLTAGEYFFSVLSDDANYHQRTARFDRLADFIEQKLNAALDEFGSNP